MDCVTPRTAMMSGARRLLLLLCIVVTLAVAGCREEGDIRIASLKFEGVKGVKPSALAAALQTKKGSWIPWGRKSYFDRRAFDADLQRITSFYREHGYPDARVSSFDVKLNDAQDQVDIALYISEGEPTLVTGIDLAGFDVLTARQQKALADSLPLLKNLPLDRQLALASRERAVNVLRDNGYPYAEVAMTEQPEGSHMVRVRLAATPGTLAHFGSIDIEGTKTVSEDVVGNQLLYKPGDLFSQRAMRDSQRKLYRLELFEFANIDANEDKTQQPPEVPTRVTVGEAKHQKVTFGVGYGSEEQARARIRWDHLNIFRGAEHAGVEAKWSSLDRGVRLEFRKPNFLSGHFSLNFDGQAWQAVEGQAQAADGTTSEPLYSLNQVGGRISLRHQAATSTFWSVSLSNEFQRSTVAVAALEDFKLRNQLIALGLDPRTGQSRGTLSAVAFDIGRDTTNNLLDARSGYVLNGHVEQAGKWLQGTYNFWSITAEARHYLPVGRRLVLANRLRIGTIDALGSDIEASVPFYRRFFLGGASSLRGWGRLEVSPLSGFGLPIGGHSMLEGSSEVRLPLVGKFGGVAFVDYGNVWAGSVDFDLKDLKVSVGPGLRYVTPVGPLRIDAGYQLTPEEGLRIDGEPEKRQWRLHFSIGQAF